MHCENNVQQQVLVFYIQQREATCYHLTGEKMCFCELQGLHIKLCSLYNPSGVPAKPKTVILRALAKGSEM